MMGRHRRPHVSEEAEALRSRAEELRRISEEKQAKSRRLSKALADIRARNNIAAAINARWKK